MPLFAPYLAEFGCTPRRLEHFGPLAVLAPPAFLRYKGDKTGQTPLLPHCDFPFAAPDGARRGPAVVRRRVEAVFALFARIGHGVLPALFFL